MSRADTSGHRVLLVGCGQLGSRHLQALVTLSRVAAIDVVDPQPEALALGQQRLQEVAQRQPRQTIRWLSSLADAAPQGDLCVVATQAEGRCELVRQIARDVGYRRFLLEKIVGQSVAEMEALAAELKRLETDAWVNCKTRAYPFHQRVKRLLRSGEPVQMVVTGGNHGLANNGIHAADLFAFYAAADAIELTVAHIDPMLHRTKRGMFDLSGTLQGSSRTGSRFMLAYAGDHEASELIAISTRSYRCLVDQLQRWAVESDSGSQWAWRPVPFEGDLTVSNMTRQFASTILDVGQCALPTLEESLVAHRFILGALQPAFCRLLERDVDLCPVT